MHVFLLCLRKKKKKKDIDLRFFFFKIISLILKEYSRFTENTVEAFVMILLLDLAALVVTVV